MLSLRNTDFDEHFCVSAECVYAGSTRRATHEQLSPSSNLSMFNGAVFPMLLPYLIVKKSNIYLNHVQARMSEKELQRKRIAAISNVHFGHRVAEGMWGNPHARNFRHQAIVMNSVLQGSNLQRLIIN